MNKIYIFSIWAMTAFFIAPVVYAAGCPSDIKSVTAKDADIDVQILSYRVKPLTKCELEVEAGAWLLLLKKKIVDISNAEVAVIYKKVEIKKVAKVEDALEEARDTKKDEGADADAVKKANLVVKIALKDEKIAEKKRTDDKTVQQALKAATVKLKLKAKDKDEGNESSGESSNENKKTFDISDKTEAGKKHLKTALLVHINDLRDQRTVLIDRFETVLTELELKGGETEEFRTYIKAVSGIKVDVTDASATWTTITGWLMSAEGGFRWALNLIKFIVIVMVFYLLSILAGKAASKALSKSKKSSSLLREFLIMTVRRVVLVVGLLVGLSALEINLGPVFAIVGAAGFVIAFALQNSLSNFASGILMLVYRPFDIGNFINVAGVSGSVESMNLLSTQLRKPDNQLVIVPNNSVWDGVITNITGISERRLDLVFGIGYSDDTEKAREILEDIVNNQELVLKDPLPVIKLHELADSSVNFVCRPWIKTENYWEVYWNITSEVKRRFDLEGISIPFPQQDIHIYQEGKE
ncbi:MAG: mechanosensitive ion channel [Thiotrichaceae bacterium]|nr:mechanosensitive ion channel [Thiotrichaceae bacterium]